MSARYKAARLSAPLPTPPHIGPGGGESEEPAAAAAAAAPAKQSAITVTEPDTSCTDARVAQSSPTGQSGVCSRGGGGDQCCGKGVGLGQLDVGSGGGAVVVPPGGLNVVDCGTGSMLPSMLATQCR